MFASCLLDVCKQYKTIYDISMSPVSGRAAQWAELEAACLVARGGGGAAARTRTAPPPGPSPGPGASRTSTPSLYRR